MNVNELKKELKNDYYEVGFKTVDSKRFLHIKSKKRHRTAPTDITELVWEGKAKIYDYHVYPKKGVEDRIKTEIWLLGTEE